MTNLNFKPFSKNELVEGLRKKFPQYKIQDSLGNLQVRTSGFTMTGNVQIINNPKKGTVTTRTNLDLMPAFLICLPPIGLYILSKKDKVKRLEAEVVEGIQSLLSPI